MKEYCNLVSFFEFYFIPNPKGKTKFKSLRENSFLYQNHPLELGEILIKKYQQKLNIEPYL